MFSVPRSSLIRSKEKALKKARAAGMDLRWRQVDPSTPATDCTSYSHGFRYHNFVVGRAACVFRDNFGTEPEIIAVAPGRVNLIGEHTDYSGGFVFPAAIDRQLWIAASRTAGPTTVLSKQRGAGEQFWAMEVRPGDLSGWAMYPAGMAWGLRELGTEVPNINAAVVSDVPIGSGISSSAALELAFGVVWNELADLGLTKLELAKLGQRCENEFVGVKCGIMDQVACAMGRTGQAMFLDTRSLQVEYLPVPESMAIVICDTGKPRALANSAYNERRAQCEEAARILGVRELRDASLSELVAREAILDPAVFRRARHVINENGRCSAFRQALAGRDREAISRLMRASHESLRDDYQVSSPELDAMAEAAWHTPGVIGARMTGAGFGGACIALVESEALSDFLSHLSALYTNKTSLVGDFLPCGTVDGARSL